MKLTYLPILIAKSFSRVSERILMVMQYSSVILNQIRLWVLIKLGVDCIWLIKAEAMSKKSWLFTMLVQSSTKQGVYIVPSAHRRISHIVGGRKWKYWYMKTRRRCAWSAYGGRARPIICIRTNLKWKNIYYIYKYEFGKKSQKCPLGHSILSKSRAEEPGNVLAAPAPDFISSGFGSWYFFSSSGSGSLLLVKFGEIFSPHKLLI